MFIFRGDFYEEVKDYFIINAGLLTLASISWAVFETKSVLAFFIWSWLYHVGLASFLTYWEMDFDDLHNFKIPAMSGKIPLPIPILEEMSLFPDLFNYYAIMIALMDTVFLNFGEYSLLPPLRKASVTRSLMYFIPVSLVADLTYDIFFYIIHRADHEMNHRFGGKHFIIGHDQHHKHVHLQAAIAYHVHPVEAIFAEELPLLASFWLISNFYDLSKLDLALILTYRMWTILGGHTNKKLKPNSTSFAQCVWLPRLFGIELHSADHNHHHVHIMCNYSARFTLWDKLFGTYKRCDYLLECDKKQLENPNYIHRQSLEKQQGKKVM